MQECNRNGRYSYGDSSTSSLTDVRKYIPYGKGDATIRYVVDNITLSDSSKSHHHPHDNRLYSAT